MTPDRSNALEPWTTALTPWSEDAAQRMLDERTPLPERVTRAGGQCPCPMCGSRNVAAVQYGKMTWSAACERQVKAGEWAFGGCLVSSDSPLLICNACGHGFGQRERRRRVGELAGAR